MFIFIFYSFDHKLYRFRVDFFTASNDAAFHITPHFGSDANYIIRNTQNNGHWQQEERTGGMPFARNDPFEMLIQVEADHFNVTVNGRHQFDYRHRVPLNQITRFGIDGQVDIHGVTYVGVSF